MGGAGEAARPAVTADAVTADAVAADAVAADAAGAADAAVPAVSKGSNVTKNPLAASSLECFTRQLCPRHGAPARVRRTRRFAPSSRIARPRGGVRLRIGGRGTDTACMGDRNVLGGELEPCGTDPLTGFYRDGCCTTGPEDLGSHTICAVVTAEFLEHQRRIGNDLSTPMPQFRFPGLVPGDRWCVTAANWLQAHRDGAAAPVVLASTHQRALEIVPLEILKPYSVDVPADLGALEE